MSASVEKAIGYLKIVTLMNEIENENVSVKEVIEAIGRINERYARRIIPSQSVHREKAWMATNPSRRGYEAHTTKSMICINSKLSLPHGGDWVDVCYLPEGAFSTDPEVKKATFLNEMEIYTILAEIGGIIGTPKVDVDVLRKQSPDKKLFNAYAQGKNDLQRIVASKL